MPKRNFNNAIELQYFAKEVFERCFNIEVLIRKPSRFRISRDVYSPDPDVAVGPFATGREKFIGDYNNMARNSRRIIESFLEMHKENLMAHDIIFPREPEFNFFCDENDDQTSINKNPRCFIAVEIENTGTLKHLLGSTINAVALGKVGLLIGFTDERVNKFLRCLRYLNYLKSVGKPNIDFENGLVLSKEQFIEILDNL